MKKKFDPKIEIFDPFKEPFSEEKEEKDAVFDQRDLDACCACAAPVALADKRTAK